MGKEERKGVTWDVAGLLVLAEAADDGEEIVEGVIGRLDGGNTMNGAG